MARQLKVYVTSIGFYDLAVAAPSMKAALDAWGSAQNLFHLGFAQETDNPEIIASALSQPGTVLRRAVGTNNSYQERAAPPKSLPANALKRQPPAKKAVRKKAAAKSRNRAQKATILSFEQAKAKRDRERARQDGEQAKVDAAQERKASRRRKASVKAQEALTRARKSHQRNARALEREVQTAQDRLEVETKRWRQEEKRLETKLHNLEE